jgi:hypothetical protein
VRLPFRLGADASYFTSPSIDLPGGDVMAKQAETQLERFTASRLYVQVILSAVLVVTTGVVRLLPPKSPYLEIRNTLVWTTRTEYDAAAQITLVNGWATRHGGWWPALTGVWADEVTRAKEWGKLHKPSWNPTSERQRVGGSQS